MAAGITLKKNLRGDVTAVTINIKKYGDMLKDFFREVGIEDQIYKPNAETRKAMKEALKTDTKKAFSSADELFNHLGI